MKSYPKRLFAIALLSVLLPAGLVYADPPWERGEERGEAYEVRHNDGRHDGYDRQGERAHPMHEQDYDRGFSDHDRDRYRRYMTSHYKKRCPHGLAKKKNGCVPPGHDKRYAIGEDLPETVVYVKPPRAALVGIQPAPQGYRYVMVDNDLLMISEATRHVIDAVSLLSNVGK